jgi:hypothetical protein
MIKPERYAVVCLDRLENTIHWSSTFEEAKRIYQALSPHHPYCFIAENLIWDKKDELSK